MDDVSGIDVVKADIERVKVATLLDHYFERKGSC